MHLSMHSHTLNFPTFLQKRKKTTFLSATGWYMLNFKQQNKRNLWSCVTVRSGPSGPQPCTTHCCPKGHGGQDPSDLTPHMHEHMGFISEWTHVVLHADKRSWALSWTKKKSCSSLPVSFCSSLPAFHLPSCGSSIFRALVGSWGSLLKLD